VSPILKTKIGYSLAFRWRGVSVKVKFLSPLYIEKKNRVNYWCYTNKIIYKNYVSHFFEVRHPRCVVKQQEELNVIYVYRQSQLYSLDVTIHTKQTMPPFP
jgi:hypothetical protein